MELTLALFVNFFIDGQYLTIEYKVINHFYDTVYLITSNTTHDAKLGPVPNPAAVQLFLSKDTLEIRKAKPKAPKDRFYTPEPFFITPLSKGEEFKETFKLALPLVVKDENLKNALDRKKKNALFVKFAIGYVVGNKYLKSKTVIKNGKPYHQLSFNPDAITPGEEVPPSVEGLLTSTVKNLPVPIKIETEK